MATQINRSAVEFLGLSNKLSSLAYIKSENEKQLLLALLIDFNSLNYNGLWHVANEKAVLVINQCCFLVPQNEFALKKQVLQLFQNLLTKQNISVDGITLTVAVTWTIECIKTSQQHAELPLTVLSYLIKGKSSSLNGQIDTIFNVCSQLSKEVVEKEPAVYFNALSCIESLSFCDETSDVSKAIALKCIEFFKNNIDESIGNISNSFWQSKCLIVSLSGISNIVNKNEAYLSDILPEIFGVAKTFMVFGSSSQGISKIIKVVPSNIALPEEHRKPPAIKKPMGKYDRKSKKKEVTAISDIVNDEEVNKSNQYVGRMEDSIFNRTITSDSDFSDSEGGMAGKIRKTQTKVRRCCLNLLGNLFLKGETKTMIRYLPSFLPDGTSQTENLMTCLLNDNSPSCRSEVLIDLSIVLKKFKQFFQLADSLSKSSFTTLSNNVANIVIELHLNLIKAIQNENYSIVITHILKTMSDLIRCTPYNKVNTSILLNLGKEIRPILHKNDVNCQIAALVAFGCITSIEPKVMDVEKVVFSGDSDNVLARCWLFDKCAQMLMSSNGCNPAVAVECLQVLAALVRNFPHETVISYPSDVYKILEMVSPEHDYLLRFYAAKFLESVVHSLQICTSSLDESKKCSMSLAAMIWNKLIFGPVTSLIQCEDQSALRSIGCDCLSRIALPSDASDSQLSSLIFDELTRSDQIACITHILGCAKDETAQVRSSAIRSLAVFVQFAALREDSLFFLDAIDVFFNSAADDNMIVKVQAAWLLGHIAEAAVLCSKEGLEDELTDAMVIRLLKASVKLSNDTKKGKPYTVRGIANLLTLVTDRIMADHREEVMLSIDCLLSSAATGNFMKARWNACYALGIALSNPIVCAEATAKAFPILAELVQNYKNFKVRISAANTLSSLPNRQSYGNFYHATWKILIAGLENAENIADFSEYQHRDHLIDEICSAMSKLLFLISLEDLVPVKDIVVHNIDLVSHQYVRFKSRIVPEKSGVIEQAYSRLSELNSSDVLLSREQKTALSTLTYTFIGSQEL